MSALFAVGTCVRIDGLQKRPDLNGTLADVVEPASDQEAALLRAKGRVQVRLSGSKEQLSVSAANLRVSIAVGTRVRIEGLQKRPELNGSYAFVLDAANELEAASLRERGRVQVRLASSNEQLSVSVANLRLAPAEARAAPSQARAVQPAVQPAVPHRAPAAVCASLLHRRTLPSPALPAPPEMAAAGGVLIGSGESNPAPNPNP
jgi:hypothetical protein